jgi:hypothetical protein
MRQLLRELAACGLVLLLPAAAAAQQGGVQVTAASHSLTGDPNRIGSQSVFEPDLGVVWLRPGTRFGMFQMEIRGTIRDDEPHLGRAYVALRDFRHSGVKYSFEAGDSFFAPNRGDYQIRNLYTPAVNFAGAAFRAHTPQTTIEVMAGKATAIRNVFGTDTETLDQTLAIGRGSRRLSDRVELSTRMSFIRTRDLREYRFTIADSDQAGGGARFALTPSIQLVGDASVVGYRRRGSTEREMDGSALAGVSVLLARGWLQANASRFSPGELPILSQPFADRQTLYAAGEYDLFNRIRVFGGWEAFRANLDESALAGSPPTDGSRGFGGVRVPIGTKSSASVRVEDGDRRARLVGASLTRVSDTGVVSGEFQTTLGSVNAFTRFARRENVESESLAGSYTQYEGSSLAFVNLTRDLQLFGSVTGNTNSNAIGGGHTYWQYGGGTQTRVMDRGLWLRAELLTSRNVDLLTDRERPQQTFSFGLNGEIARNTAVSVNVYADRLNALDGSPGDSWLARSSVRVTRTFPGGSHRQTLAMSASMARHGGTGSVIGLVFTDWNGNGQQDVDELPVENIPVRLANLGHTSTSRAGEFAFMNVPIGMQQVGIDLMSLPVDFDTPPVPHVHVELQRGETRRLAFGLTPLGSIGGRVVRDRNGNGQADEGEEGVTQAVLSLDGGVRSEQVRNGEFRFDAVRSGPHTVELLAQSLPEGGRIVGEPSLSVTIDRSAIAPVVTYVVVIEPRPEIRRVFPADQPRPAQPAARQPDPPARPPASTPRSASMARLPEAAGARPRPTPAPPVTREGSTPAPGKAQFAIQITAVNDPLRATGIIEQLRKDGYTAYLVLPPASDPDAPYKVRVGFYSTRAEADQEARVIEKRRKEKVWVVRER